MATVSPGRQPAAKAELVNCRVGVPLGASLVMRMNVGEIVRPHMRTVPSMEVIVRKYCLGSSVKSIGISRMTISALNAFAIGWAGVPTLRVPPEKTITSPVSNLVFASVLKLSVPPG